MGFTGYYADAESGLNYAQQRYQLPGIGRFLSVDPGPMLFERPITLNRYLYANGNPLIYVDPDGRIALLESWRASVNQFGQAALAFAEDAGRHAHQGGLGSRVSAAVGWAAGGAGYVASMAGEVVVAGANMGANAVSIAAAEAGAALGSENVFTPLASEARAEIDALVADAAPGVQAFEADAIGTTKAAAIGAAVGLRDQVVAAARGDDRAIFELAANVNPARALKSLGNSVARVVEAPKPGAPTAAIVSESDDGSRPRLEQARDSKGRFLPKDGSELKPGGPFEDRVGEVLADINTDVLRQITIRAPDGTVTRLDYASIGPDGRIKLTEAKGSATAQLTEKQRKAIPQIEKVGGVVMGEGNDAFPRGTVIPPTPVRIVRPETIERLERMRRHRQEQSQ